MEFVVIAVLLGLIPGVIAHKKGHSFGKWWFAGAMLFIIALPMAIMLKPVGEAARAAGIASTSGLRKCPKCAELIQPEAEVCRFCRAEVTPLTPAEQAELMKAAQIEAEKGTHVPAWAVVLVLVVVGLSIYGMAKNDSSAGSAGGGNPINSGMGGVLAEDYVVRVSGSDGCKFQGTYMLVTADGQSQSKSVEGRVPAEYTMRGSIVSTSFQKHEEGGMLKVQILKGGRLVNESETSAAYGVVTAASN